MNHRQGYDDNFLGHDLRAPLPILQERSRNEAFENGRALAYTHFSVIMNRARRFALFTAHNLDGARMVSVSRRRTAWRLDDRLDATLQVGDEFYRQSRWTRGHLVRRRDVLWGGVEEARRANADTFHFTNACPQHQNFNGDEWLLLEDWILDLAREDCYKLCVFTGPVFASEDLVDRGIRVPDAYWKVIVRPTPDRSGGVRRSALGFLMKQSEFWDDQNGAQFIELRTYQLPVRKIGELTHLDFHSIADDDELPIERPTRGFGRRPWPEIRGPEDLVLRENPARSSAPRPVRSLRGGEETAETSAREAPRGRCGCDDSFDAEQRIQRLEARVMELGKLVAELADQDAAEAPPNRIGRSLHRDGGGEAPKRRIQRALYRVIGGRPCTDQEYRSCVCVGSLTGERPWFCSGVLIAPGVVLTAAHCLDVRQNDGAAFADRIFVGRSLIDLKRQISRKYFDLEVSEIRRHKDYDPNRNPSNDLALLRVAGAPAAGWQGLVASIAELNSQEISQLVGFGSNSRRGIGGFGDKRVAEAEREGFVAGAEDDQRRYDYSNEYEFVIAEKNGKLDTCEGDSGGPVYQRDRVVGLTLRPIRSEGDSMPECGPGGVYARISKYLPWIQEVCAEWNMTLGG